MKKSIVLLKLKKKITQIQCNDFHFKVLGNFLS